MNNKIILFSFIVLTTFNSINTTGERKGTSLTKKQLHNTKERIDNNKILQTTDTKLLKYLDLDEITEGIPNSYEEIKPQIVQPNNISRELSINEQSSIVDKLNIDVYNVIKRYMDKTQYIPIKDPLWFMALGMVEYNYQENPEGLWFSFPVKLEDYYPTFIEEYSWEYVYSNWGLEATTRRTGGAIGPYQLESFFASNVDGVIPEDLGERQDCWITLGTNPTPQYGSSIQWAKGLIADRWSIKDSANLVLDVYDTTLRRVNGQCALTELEDRYAQITLLMWAHNRGTGILGNSSYSSRASKIAEYVDELKELINTYDIRRFTRSNLIMPTIKRIANECNSDIYPVMSLISYLILEKEVNR